MDSHVYTPQCFNVSSSLLPSDPSLDARPVVNINSNRPLSSVDKRLLALASPASLPVAGAAIPTVCVASLRKGTKYFISGRLENEKTVTFIIDSAADISIIPPSLTSKTRWNKIPTPFSVDDFSGNYNARVEFNVNLEIRFMPGVVKSSFYICDAAFPIIGNDLLRHHSPPLSLETGTNVFKIDTIVLRVKSSTKESIAELIRREKLGAFAYRSEYTRFISSVAWMRLRRRTAIAPNSSVDAEAYIESARSVTHDHSFLSFFDNGCIGGDLDIVVHSANYEEKQLRYVIPIKSNIKEAITLPRDFVLGEVVNHPPDNTFSTGMRITPLGKYIDEHSTASSYASSNSLHAPPSAAAISSSKSSTSAHTKTANLPSKSASPIPLSSLVDRGRLPASEIANCRENGIQFDLHLQHQQPKLIMKKIAKIDVEREISKKRKEEYWPDKNAFLSEFPCLKDIPSKYVEKAENLLYSFRHVFFNPDRPDQFRRGINITPIKMDRVPGKIPRKEKVRQISAKKKAHLQWHIDSLLARGVIEEADDVVDCYASNVHVVIERRYVASKGAVVEKSRATGDCREINKVLPESSYTLPNMEEFRREITSEGYRVFTNFDAVEMYHQLPVDKECARRNFNIHALGKIYTFLRGLQGNKLMPSVCQKFSATAFESVNHTTPFIDDFTCKSKDEDTHLDINMPEMLAICSFYNILLRPGKTDLMRSTARVLGYQIAEQFPSATKRNRK